MKSKDDLLEKLKQLLDPENLEMLAVFAMLLPIVFSLVTRLLRFAFSLPMQFMHKVRSYIKFTNFLVGFVQILLILLLAALIAGLIYNMLTIRVNQNLWGYIAIGAVGLSFLSCISMLFKWPKALVLIFGILSVVYGIHMFCQVVLMKSSLDAEPNLAEEFRMVTDIISAYIEKTKQEKAAMEAAERAAKADPNTTASYFDGDGLTLLGLILLTSLVSAISCGIAAPWMICKVYKWRYEHTVINGRRLVFDGNGASLLGHWILWELLTLITCGIYGFFAYVALKKWELTHVRFVDFRMGDAPVSDFDGNSFEYFGYGLLGGLLTTLTCSLGFPWAACMLMGWETKHSIVNGNRLGFNGDGLSLFGQYIIIALLSAVTCGIYSSWGVVRMNRWIISHTYIEVPSNYYPQGPNPGFDPNAPYSPITPISPIQ